LQPCSVSDNASKTCSDVCHPKTASHLDQRPRNRRLAPLFPAHGTHSHSPTRSSRLTSALRLSSIRCTFPPPPSRSSHSIRPYSATQMGNLCGKQSKDGFDGPGRTLGSAPAPATKASVPSSAKPTPPKRTVGGPPRTLGETNAAAHPAKAAADAAEVRTLQKSGERRTVLMRAYM